MSHVRNGSLTRLLAVLAVSCLLEGASANDAAERQPPRPAASGADKGAERMRVPNKAAQKKAAEMVAEVYGDAISKAKKPAEKAALAEQFLKTGRQRRPSDRSRRSARE